MAFALAKKQQKKKKKVEFVCHEPVRQSLYDVLVGNMHLLQRNVFIHRIIYFGSHTFPTGDVDNIGVHFKANIEHINSTYCEEYLTGFLLYYTRHFIHLLDGSEDSIKKHLEYLMANEASKENLRSIKVLVCYHNINQRFLHSWIEISAKPPNLLHKIKFDLDAKEARAKILMCLTKIYKFAYLLRSNEETATEETPVDGGQRKLHSSFFEIGEEVFANPRQSSFVPAVSSIGMSRMDMSSVTALHSMTRGTNCIPEQQLMDFLVETPYLMDIQDYMQHYGAVPMCLTFKDKSWPVESDYIPRNIFEPDFDPVTDIAQPEIDDVLNL